MSRLLIKNVNIIDSLNGGIENQNIFIEDGVIKEIFGESAITPEADEVLDLGGKWLMPGLIDMHTHLNAETGINKSRMSGALWRANTPPPLKAMHFLSNAQKTLMAGFTTIRNCGHVTYYMPEDVAVREAINKELVVGPNIVACAGFITMTAGHGDLSFNRNLRRLPEFGYGDRCFDGPWGCVEGVREKIRHGADFIKIMASGGMGSSGDEPDWTNYTVEELSAMVKEAHDLKRKTAAHSHCAESSRRCVEAGIDTIEHGCGLTDELCEKMAANGQFLTPTMRVIHACLESNDPEEAYKAGLLVDIHESALKSALKANVKLCYGTDSINALKHGENGLEILNLLDSGVPVKKIFDALTYVSAQALGRDNKIGLVKEGMMADLIVIDNNPLNDITILSEAKNVKVIIRNGKVVKNIMEK